MSLLHRVKKSLSRRTDEFLRGHPALRRWRIDRAIDAEANIGDAIRDFQLIVPAQAHVSLGATPQDERFLRVAKYFREGWYPRSSIFVCEVLEAFCHIGTGLICTRDFTAINDSQMTYRMAPGPAAVGNKIYRPFQWFKPRRVKSLRGTYATISNVYMRYWGHWIFDCLPRLYSLNQVSAGKPVTLLVPDNLPKSWVESLACVMPANFQIQHLPDDSWVQAERMLLASYPSGRANSHMPREFYDFVRQSCFAKFGLAPENRPSERIYVSRAGTRHRRIRNEPQLIELLSRYGFFTAALEKLSFRQQVELFHRAEVIVAADGSNWANMIFAGEIPVFVLYSHAEPNTHWFTAAKGLGQQHYFLAGTEETPHSDFEVDLSSVEKVLKDEIGLAAKQDA